MPTKAKVKVARKLMPTTRVFMTRDALGKGLAVVGWMFGVPTHHPLAQPQTDPGQQSTGEGAGEKTERTLALAGLGWGSVGSGVCSWGLGWFDEPGPPAAAAAAPGLETAFGQGVPQLLPGTLGPLQPGEQGEQARP